MIQRKTSLLARPNRQKTMGILPDLAPMLDVVFLLLVFFVLSYSASKAEFLGIELPQAQSAESHEATPTPHEVLINAKGQFIYQEIVYLSIDEFAIAVAPAVGQNPVFIISADARASYQSIVSALDILGKMGFARIRLNTQNDPHNP